MLTIPTGKSFRFCDGLTRRNVLQIGALALGGLSLPDLLRLRASGAAQAKAAHKAVILVYLNGGASQLDMFDMKPDAPAEFRGEFKPIETNVPGMRVSEHLPLQSKIADKFTVLNGMQVVTSGHGTYEISTGFGGAVMPKRPSVGAVVSRFGRSADNGMPPWVSMMQDYGPAFLGAAHGAFSPSGGLMNDLRGGGSVPQERSGLLQSLDRLRGDAETGSELQASDAFTAKALEMLASTKVRDAFDLGKEPESVKAKYGKQVHGGTNLLLALRLAAAGVSFITAYGPANLKWDTHQNNFKQLREQVLPEYDRAIHAMITDLYDRGLDKDVLVLIMGEFGRTTRVNRQAGRDHYPASTSVQIAGGGFKMGQTIGNTGQRGDWDISRSKPYTIQNLYSTVYRFLGIDPDIKVPDNFGRPQYLLDQRETITELL
ncbi:MAG: DUF1501 domain-containing protein [Planctomycetia bacterium]|nr:DUF1501 domain-containing protein [Planctomycetia bacterium]